jgi:hypothetical protein
MAPARSGLFGCPAATLGFARVQQFDLSRGWRRGLRYRIPSGAQTAPLPAPSLAGGHDPSPSARVRQAGQRQPSRDHLASDPMRPRRFAFLLAAAALGVSVLASPSAKSQVSTFDCSVYLESIEAFRSCLKSNRIAEDANRNICISYIDLARKAAARGDSSGWSRVPTWCLY